MYLFLTSALAEAAPEATAAVETVEQAVERAEAAPTWAQELVEKFTEISGRTGIILGVLVLLGVILLVIGRTRRQWSAKRICSASRLCMQRAKASVICAPAPAVCAASAAS